MGSNKQSNISLYIILQSSIKKKSHFYNISFWNNEQPDFQGLLLISSIVSC
jgi:hypothetical protein